MSASIVRASSRRPCDASSRARLIVARNSQAFACIFWASAIASRKSASASSVWPSLSRSSPRQVSALGRKTSSSGFACERLLDGDESVVDLAVERLGLGQTREMIRDTQPASGLGQAGQALADQRNAFTRAAELRPRPAEHRAGQIPDERKAVLFSDG